MTKVLFLGAGASYGSRRDFKPPLGNDLLDYFTLRIKKALHEKIRKFPRQQFMPGYYISMIPDVLSESEAEDLIKKLELAKKKGLKFEDWAGLYSKDINVIQPMNRALGYIFSGIEDPEFIERKDLYDCLLQKIKIDQNWIIVSLNYDILIEDALRRMGVPFYYPGIKYGNFGLQVERGVRVFKPHGSFNWHGMFLHASANVRIAESVASCLEIENDTFTVEDRALVSNDRVHFLAALDRKHWMPVMATFCNEKSTMTNFKKLIAHRQSCIESILGPNESIVLGVRPTAPEVDRSTYRILSLLNWSRRSIFVNPSSVDCNELRSRFTGYLCVQKSLDEFLAMESWDFSLD